MAGYKKHRREREYLKELREQGFATRAMTVKCSEDQYVRFKIKLDHMSIAMRGFMLMCIEGFINDDPQFIDFFRDHRDKYTYGNKTWKKVIQKEEAQQQEIEEEYNLSEQEITNIFDLIEEECVGL